VHVLPPKKRHVQDTIHGPVYGDSLAYYAILLGTFQIQQAVIHASI